MAILLLGLSAWFAREIVLRTEQDVVGASGFVLTAWGVVISLAGFAVTWWQLARTQTAASAAQRAVLKLKRAFGSLDIITELRTARESARQTRTHIETARWAEAAVGFDRTREGLNKIVAINGMLAQPDSEATRDFISICIDGYQSSQRLVADATAPISVETLLVRLQELDGFLIEVEFKIKDGMNANE